MKRFGAWLKEMWLKLIGRGKEKVEAVVDGDSTPAVEAPVTVEEDDDTPDRSDTGGDKTFLWKPVAETRGHVCVILLPWPIQQVETIRRIAINGDYGQVKDWRNGYANGGRIHVFLRKPGANYGWKPVVTLPMADGTVREWTVSHGAYRFEVDEDGR